MTKKIIVVGVGRMGKGIALTFAYSGYSVVLVDSEVREEKIFIELKQNTIKEIKDELLFLNKINVIAKEQIDNISQRIQILAKSAAMDEINQADYVFEAVAEILEVKQSVYAWLCDNLNERAVVASATSTMSADTLAEFTDIPERYLNAHWLNPAHLMPLVELSPNMKTNPDVTEALKSFLEGIGKVPVVCKPSPGFIVSRIQALAMNEAARMVQEGVASAEDIDKAIKTGFGIRYATLGLLEFIDWGGGDILYHATDYLSKNIDQERFSIAENVKENMANHRNGLRDGIGFYDWKNCDVDTYRHERLTAFVRLLQHFSLMPSANVAERQ